MRKSRLRIHGNDRFLMQLCKDIRRRWMQYGENRKVKQLLCAKCEVEEVQEVDHIEPVGKRPYTIEDLVPYIKRMLFLPCQGLCKKCHSQKTAEQRKKN